MIFVDELRQWPHAKGIFRKGSSHLATDGRIEELHRFAESIGLRKEWFQSLSAVPHYDLTPAKRSLAVREGAEEVTARELLQLCRQAGPA